MVETEAPGVSSKPESDDSFDAEFLDVLNRIRNNPGEFVPEFASVLQEKIEFVKSSFNSEEGWDDRNIVLICATVGEELKSLSQLPSLEFTHHSYLNRKKQHGPRKAMFRSDSTLAEVYEIGVGEKETSRPVTPIRSQPVSTAGSVHPTPGHSIVGSRIQSRRPSHGEEEKYECTYHDVPGVEEPLVAAVLMIANYNDETKSNRGAILDENATGISIITETRPIEPPSEGDEEPAEEKKRVLVVMRPMGTANQIIPPLDLQRVEEKLADNVDRPATSHSHGASRSAREGSSKRVSMRGSYVRPFTVRDMKPNLTLFVSETDMATRMDSVLYNRQPVTPSLRPSTSGTEIVQKPFDVYVLNGTRSYPTISPRPCSSTTRTERQHHHSIWKRNSATSTDRVRAESKPLRGSDAALRKAGLVKRESIEHMAVVQRKHISYNKSLGNPESRRLLRSLSLSRQLTSINKSTCLDRALQLIAEGNFGDAIHSLSAAIEMEDKKSLALYLRGCLFQQMGLQYLAIFDIDTSLAMNPKPSESHVYLKRAEILSELEDWPKAVRAYEDHIRIEGLTSENMEGYAYALMMSGRCEEAKELYDSILVANPDNHLALVRRASCYMKLGYDEHAEADIQEAERLRQEAAKIMEEEPPPLDEELAQVDKIPDTALEPEEEEGEREFPTIDEVSKYKNEKTTTNFDEATLKYYEEMLKASQDKIDKMVGTLKREATQVDMNAYEMDPSIKELIGRKNPIMSVYDPEEDMKNRLQRALSKAKMDVKIKMMTKKADEERERREMEERRKKLEKTKYSRFKGRKSASNPDEESGAVGAFFKNVRKRQSKNWFLPGTEETTTVFTSSADSKDSENRTGVQPGHDVTSELNRIASSVNMTQLPRMDTKKTLLTLMENKPARPDKAISSKAARESYHSELDTFKQFSKQYEQQRKSRAESPDRPLSRVSQRSARTPVL